MIDLEELITKPRKATASLSELVPWFGLIDDGVVLCQDGGLVAGFALPGMALEGVDDDMLNGQIELMQRTLRGMSDRITIWSVLERRFDTTYADTPYLNPVARAIDDAWADKVTSVPHAHLTHQVFFGYQMTGLGDAFFDAVRIEMDTNDTNVFAAVAKVLVQQFSAGGTVAKIRGRLAEMLGDFEKICSGFSGMVESRLGFRRMYGPDLLGALYGRVNLASPAGPLRLPDHRLSYLAQAIPTDTLVRQKDLLEFNGPTRQMFAAALSTTGMPAENYSFHVDALMAANCEFTLVQMFQFLDREVAQSTIQKAEQYYRMEVKSLGTRVAEKLMKTDIDKVNTGNLALAQDAQSALAELTATDISYGYYAMTCLCVGDTPREATRAAELVSASLRSNGYAVVREVNGIMPAFLTTLPGNNKTALRKYLASSANLSDLMPLRTIAKGDEVHQLFTDTLGRTVPAHVRFLTDYGVPYDFSPHEMDLGHTAIIGGSGAGKTTLMHLLIAQFQKYFPANTYIFDKDHSMMVLVLLLGGRHIDLSITEGRRIGMNPVRRMLLDHNDLVLRKWVEVLMTAGDPSTPVTPAENEEIYAAIQQLKDMPDTLWRLGQLYSLINGRNRDLALRLAPYVDRSEDPQDTVRRGAFSSFFDNDEDAFTLTDIVGMETGKLLTVPQIASPFMDYAFYCIEQRLDGRTPTMIYVEEAWYMLSNPTFAAKMDDWLRTFRKKRAFLMFATQALDEIAQMKSVGAFISNVPTRIFLPSINNSVAANAGLYRSIFSLNDAQLQMLSQAIPKRDYLITKAAETKMVVAEMPPIILKINDATSKAHLRDKATEMANTGDPDWAQRYLQEVLHVDIPMRS